MRHPGLLVLLILVACFACAFPGGRLQERPLVEPASTSPASAGIVTVTPAVSRELNPGKVLLIAVGTVCAALVVLLMIQGPHL